MPMSQSVRSTLKKFESTLGKPYFYDLKALYTKLSYLFINAILNFMLRQFLHPKIAYRMLNLQRMTIQEFLLICLPVPC